MQFRPYNEDMISREGFWVVGPDGPPIGSVRDALDLIGEAGMKRAWLIVVPKCRMDPAFFDLKTRMAGEFLQRMVTYRKKFAVIGDFSTERARSEAFRDFLIECERGRNFFFVPDPDSLLSRLSL